MQFNRYHLWIAAALVIVGLFLIPWLVGYGPENDPVPWAIAVGRLHPVLLHLPIGVASLLLCGELLTWLTRKPTFSEGSFAYGFLAMSSIAAVAVGTALFVGDRATYASETADRHLWGGLVFAALCVILWVAKTLERGGAKRGWSRGLLIVTTGVMVIAAHDGSTLTHGSDYLTAHLPDWAVGGRALKPKPKPDAEIVVYRDIIQPIFEQRCVQCHKEGKAKGRLRMDTFEWMLKGGKEGPAILPGDVAGSPLISRIHLPLDDDEHMPPEGKAQLTEDEIGKIERWLARGASPSQTAREMDF